MPKVSKRFVFVSRLRYIGVLGWAPPCQHIRRLPCRESCIASRGVGIAEPTAAECQHTCMLATAPWRLRPLVSWWHYQLIAAPMSIGQLTALHFPYLGQTRLLAGEQRSAHDVANLASTRTSPAGTPPRSLTWEAASQHSVRTYPTGAPPRSLTGKAASQHSTRTSPAGHLRGR
jgi:hypothetical protein